MANIFKDLIQRIKIDWQEWRAYRASYWNVRRDTKAVNRAITRAKEKNFSNGKTYYIMRDKFGGINELNSDELLFFTRKGMFSKDQYDRRFEQAIDIVTSNQHIRNQYYRIHHNTETNE
jgi:hypothetical protein